MPHSTVTLYSDGVCILLFNVQYLNIEKPTSQLLLNPQEQGTWRFQLTLSISSLDPEIEEATSIQTNLDIHK